MGTEQLLNIQRIESTYIDRTEEINNDFLLFVFQCNSLLTWENETGLTAGTRSSNKIHRKSIFANEYNSLLAQHYNIVRIEIQNNKRPKVPLKFA